MDSDRFYLYFVPPCMGVIYRVLIQVLWAHMPSCISQTLVTRTIAGTPCTMLLSMQAHNGRHIMYNTQEILTNFAKK